MKKKRWALRLGSEGGFPLGANNISRGNYPSGVLPEGGGGVTYLS